MTSDPHGYLALFVPKTLLVVWYFIMNLIPSNFLHFYSMAYVLVQIYLNSYKLYLKSWHWFLDLYGNENFPYTDKQIRIRFRAELIPIYLHLDKVSRKQHLRIASLSKQHTLNSFLDSQHLKKAKSYHLSIGNLTSI